MTARKVFLSAVIVSATILNLFGCASTPSRPAAEGEQMIWASHTDQPKWVYKTPEADSGILYFVGLSDEAMASEKMARNDAMDDARVQVVSHFGELVKKKSEEIALQFGLSSTVVDPTVAKRQYENLFAMNVAKAVKANEYYLERWRKPTGVGYKAYVLATFSKNAANASLSETADKNIQEAQKEAREAATQTAKEQAENVMNFWKSMKENGLDD